MTPSHQNRFIYRWGTQEDIEQVATVMKAAFEESNEMADWARMMMDGRHASSRAENTAVVEERITGKIVAVITTAPQTWYYAGVPLRAMNITEVGTHPDFQGQGLVSGLVDMIHQTLSKQGYDISLVWGIPWFYRKYGYIQTLGNKASTTYARNGILVAGSEHEKGPYHIRPFVREDILFAVELHRQSMKHNLISFPYDESYWNMYVFDYFEENRDQYCIVEKGGQPVGVFIHNSYCDRTMCCYMFDLIDGVSWIEVLPHVTRYMLSYGDAQLNVEGRSVEVVTYSLREGHPVYEIMRQCFSRTSQIEQNYYRIVDMRSFLLRIAPVLEQRIADSFICGYTRTVSLQLFELKQLLVMDLYHGRLRDVRWEDNPDHQFKDIHMPIEAFMHLLFGQKDIEELMVAYREVGSWNSEPGLDNEMRLLLKVLFPKQPSHINHPL